VSCYVAAAAIERGAPGAKAAAADPALWREIRRFNLPAKLALVAAHRALAALAEPSRATLIALAPCLSGSAEQRAALREGSAMFARGAAAKLRVNPIHTLHGVDNLALSALSVRLSNREPCACLGGAAGQAWLGLEQAIDELAAGGASTHEILVFGGDQGEASLRGEAVDSEACGVAIALTARPARARIVEIERAAGASGETRPHAARGLARWLDALAAAPAGRFAYRVPAEDGDGVDELTVIAEVS
jgi:hypothetical protein